jgi:cytochrome b subunit of formate dehydrogenase
MEGITNQTINFYYNTIEEIPRFIDIHNVSQIKKACEHIGYLTEMPKEIYWFLYALLILIIIITGLLLFKNYKNKKMEYSNVESNNTRNNPKSS